MELNVDNRYSEGLTVVIPCFNESRNLPRLLVAINEILTESKNIEFIIVENGSTDNSRLVLQNQEEVRNLRVLFLDNNHGYGAGVLAGIEVSRTDWTGWIHADLQTPLGTIPDAYELARKSSQPVKGIRKGRSLSERLFTFGMSLACSTIFAVRLSDINGQPTLYPTPFLQSCKKPPRDFSMDLYFYIKARKSGYRFERVAAEMSPRIDGKSSWNTGLKSRMMMVERTLRYSLQLRKRIE
jgi:hypothetical protein